MKGHAAPLRRPAACCGVLVLAALSAIAWVHKHRDWERHQQPYMDLNVVAAERVHLAERARRAADRGCALHAFTPARSEARTCAFPFRFFVYPLPAAFNTRVYRLFDVDARDREGWRTGPHSTHPSIFNDGDNMLQFSFELLIHWELEQHACRTTDPAEATFFFVPVYAFYLHWFSRATGADPSLETALLRLDAALRDPQYAATFFHFVDAMTVAELEAGASGENASYSERQYPHFSALRAVCSRELHRRVDGAAILPSSLKSFWWRRHLCDHVMVASRQFASWDGTFLWQSRRGYRAGPIFVGLEPHDSKHTRERWRLDSLARKNIAVPQVVSGDLYHARAVLCAQLCGPQRTAVRVAPLCNHSLSESGPRFAHCGHFTPAENALLAKYLGMVARCAEGGPPPPSGIPCPSPPLARPCLVLFIGSPINPLRLRLHDLLAQHPRAAFYNLLARGTSRDVSDPAVLLAYLQATFCIVPPGDAPSSKRLYSVIAAGCIPVIVADEFVLPFPFLPWHRFSLR